MARAPRLYIISYDICDPKRLHRIYKVMRGYGDHLQYSVFRCVLSEKQMAELTDRIGREIHHEEDQVLFVPLGPADSPTSWEMNTMGLPLVHPERSVKVL